VAAGAGESAARERFARTYHGLIRAYLAARWRLPPTSDAIDDASQEVFVQCFKQGGALLGVDPRGPARFRSYLFAIVKRGAVERSRHAGQLTGRPGSRGGRAPRG